MLLTLCKHCGKFLKEGELLYPVQVDEGSGLITNKEVCESCYEVINNPTLLCEQV